MDQERDPAEPDQEPTADDRARELQEHAKRLQRQAYQAARGDTATWYRDFMVRAGYWL